jgi:hypothetical protein
MTELDDVYFEMLRPLLRISPQRIEAARLVLLRGVTLAQVGRDFDCSRQAVSQCCDIIRKAWSDYQLGWEGARRALPPGYTLAVLGMPREMFERVQLDVAEDLAAKVAKVAKKESSSRGPKRDKQGTGRNRAPAAKRTPRKAKE